MILPEVGAVIAVISAAALTGEHIGLWLVALAVVLAHTLLFYRLGRISERRRSDPPPDFVRELAERLTGGHE